MQVATALMIALFTLTFALASNKYQNIQSDFNTSLISSEVGKLVVNVANGYIRKIVDYESETGISFVGENVGDFIELTDEAVYNALKSDGSMVVTEPSMTACVRNGVTIGTAIRSYLNCDTAPFIPGGTNGKAYARFERVNLTTVPDTYTTGYSQIEGVIYLGSNSADEPFSFNEGDPSPYLADKIAQWASITGTMTNSSNVLTAPVVDIDSTDAGAIRIRFTMVRNNQLVVRTDGSVPMSGSLNFAQNGIDDIDNINFSSRSGGTVYDTGNIQSNANSSTDMVLSLNANNQLELIAADQLRIQAPDVQITGDVTLTGDFSTTGDITGQNLQIRDSGRVENVFSAGEGQFDTEVSAQDGTFTGTVRAAEVETDNGVLLSYQVKDRGVVSSGNTIPDISCPAGQQRNFTANIVDIAPEGRPITGQRIVPSIHSGSGLTQLTIRLSLEDGAVVNAPTGSYMNYEQWCEDI